MTNQEKPLITLSQLKEGQTGIIHSIQGGFSLRTRMMELGVIQGEKVRVLRNFGHGPIMIEVKGTRIGLGRGVTMKILVKTNS